MPGLRFQLFGFAVTIGVDFFLITLILGLQLRPGLELIEWVVVVAVSILIHELGHAFAVSRYGIHPEIRLWGMGGLTIYGFALPPRKSILVSLAGPLVGIPVAVVAMVLRPWLPSSDPVALIVGDLIYVNLFWGVLNLLPVAGLDGGNVVANLFELAMGQRGRTPGLVLVGVCSVAIAIGAALTGFVYLTVVIFFFALFSPEPYLVLWRGLSGGRGGAGAGLRARGSAIGRPVPGDTRQPEPRSAGQQPGKRPIAIVAAEARRAFGEAYVETLAGHAASGEGPSTALTLDLDEFESRPAPLLADVAAIFSRRDDPGVAARLESENDPLAVLGIVARVVEAKRVSQLLGTMRRQDTAERVPGLLKLQVGLHSLGSFEDSIAAAAILGRSGGAHSAVLEARSAARMGDRKRTAAALERAISLGPVQLSDAALGDIVRLGPDSRVADLLSRLRNARA
jgi:Zn-dependent protease